MARLLRFLQMMDSDCILDYSPTIMKALDHAHVWTKHILNMGQLYVLLDIYTHNVM